MPVNSHRHFRSLGTSVDVSRNDLLRTDQLSGKDYLVAPVVPIRSGVHNREYVSYEELTVWPEMWSGCVLPIDHPMDENNEPLTANSPKVMNDSVIGFLFNVVAREDIQGISGELWIDIEKAATVPGGEEVLRKLHAGEKLEVSTGYFTIIDNIAGEWRNPKNGQVEKFTSSQSQIRPDHLALLPFDLGACSWKDGCGAPRINSTENVAPVDHTVKLQITEETTLAEKKKMEVNGKQLGTALSAAIAANADASGSTDHIVSRLAVAADITVDKVQELLAGKMDFAPRRWLSIFAAVLDMDPWDVYAASGNDNANARYAVQKEDEKSEENISENSDATLTTTHNEQDNKTAAGNTACGCPKSLKTKVLEVLQSLGITKAAEVKEDKTKQMNTNEAKKAKVDALIASDKNKFAETHREWLTGLSDDQLDAFEVPAVAAVAPVANTEVKAEVKPEVKAEVKAEVKQAALSKDELLSILGVSDDDLKAAKSINDEKKAARNAKIGEIIAAEKNVFSKGELETFSDLTLDKTLEMLTPAVPFRTAAGVKQTTKESQIPTPPSILLAKPGEKGVDFAVQTAKNKSKGIN